jgi:hypothetical protein
VPGRENGDTDVLILNRQPGQSLIIRPQSTLDPATPVGELFRAEPIQVRVTDIKGKYVRLGVTAHGGLCILRDELKPEPAGEILPGDTRLALALKLRVLMHLRHQTTDTLALAAKLPRETVWKAECGAGLDNLADLTKIARALRVKPVDLFRPPGRTEEERAILHLLENGD